MKKFRLLTGVWLGLFGFSCSQSAVAEFETTFGTGANQFTMNFVPIGSPSNVADTTGSPNPVGSVAYNYSIGKFEVNEDMITKYNAGFGTANGLAIIKDTRGTNRPATSVSWNEATRFTNWLNTSTGGFAAYKFTTSGVNDNIALWTPAETEDYNSANPFRSLRSNYFLPNFNEWYKAAYFDPTTNTYFDYPTGSNTAPTAVPSGTLPDRAVYNGQSGPADVNNAGGLSPFGVMGLGGNVWEWEETEADLVNNSESSIRGIRGGSWFSNSSNLLSSFRGGGFPGDGNDAVGFRVASLSLTAVPEPSSMLLAVSLGLGGLMYRRRRWRK